jgi:hypothetical protein
MQHAWERLKNAYNILVGKPVWDRPLGRPRHRWDDIKIDLKDIGCEGAH